MDISLVAAELRGPVRRVPALPIGSRLFLRFVQAAGKHMRTAPVEGVRIEDVTDVRPKLRMYQPLHAGTPAALLWIHGGGYVLGHPRQDDARCAGLARTLGITVVSVDYRLAPRHRFPVPLEDCYTGWMWLQRNAERLGVDLERIAVAGESAGAGLAACLVQRLHGEGHRAPAAQMLSAPMLDDRTAARGEADVTDHLVWNNHRNRIGWRGYLGAEPGAATAPAYSVAARHDDLTGLPPTWIGVGDLDLFHDENLAYAQRLQAVGVDVTVDVVPGAPHGFDHWAAGTDIARQYNARADEWLGRILGLTPVRP
ncbi:alpha/beta hydrolase [Nocardia sp. NPDC050630]|uniref:alpha/beta hydrolase n=1 Tax=Nocardia sp. NPDC050630 TaxID=3364321 RepID=UPI0037B8EBE2